MFVLRVDILSTGPKCLPSLWFNPFVTHTQRAGRAALVGALALALAGCGGGSAGSATGALAAPTFVNQAASSGIDHVYDGEFEFFVGGGVAAFDCNADGFDELFFAGGTRPAALYRNDSSIGSDLRFTQITSPVTDLTSVTGAYPLDIDSDGIEDLVVLRRGVSVVLRGLGNCAFEDANVRFGLDDDGWTAAFSATWEGSNSLPTLAFGHYLVPGTSDCADSSLVRPTAAGDTYGPAIALSPGYCTLSVLFSDWSRSGERDLRMTNDRHYYTDGEDQLWKVPAGQPPLQYTAADGWRPLHLWGMGIASQDVTGDGRPEVFVTSQADNKLQTLDDGTGEPAYHDMALQAGVTAQRPFTGGDVLPSTAWHAEFADVNNDGFSDLFVSKGNVDAQPDYASKDPNDLFLGRGNGTYVEGAEAA
ncbi:MAG: uncharacterized protein JWN99_110, partial [Ilumatobacteraceae bacterium]|nr:uncharacterized protein [Ilumatobacteraceae bacterium]